MANKAKKTIFICVVFAVVFMLHFLNFRLASSACENGPWFQEYIKGQEYLLGISYGLSFAFIAFAFLKFKENTKHALKAAVAGGLLAVILWFLCFLFGCCGSPMLIVYLNLIGISALKVPKLVLLLITIISIGIGYLWLSKKIPRSCCNGRPCKEDKR